MPGGVTRWAVVVVVIVVLFVIASIFRSIYANWLWFDSVESASGQDYLSVFKLRITTRIWLFFAGLGVFLVFFGANLLLALRQAARSGGITIPWGDVEPIAARRVIVVVGLAATLFIAVIFGAQAASQWDNILLFIHSEPFGVKDPAFSRDVGFYIFQLPALNFIAGWSLALVILTTIGVVAVYASQLLLAESRAQAPGLARPHVSLLLVIAIALFVWRYWLGRYALVYSERGAAFGAGWTDIHAQLPVIYALMAFGAVTALLVLVSMFQRRLLVLPVGAAVLWVVAAIVGGIIFPTTVQRFQVEPNELVKERPYIARNIAATRSAYALNRIEEKPYPANAAVTAAEIEANPDTVKNIRLWDHRPLLQTLNQVQALRQLYDFRNVDVDRYVIDGDLRQVMLSVRELDSEKLPADAQGWVNRRLEFTHGFGLAMSPVNEVVQEGLPDFFVKDIPPTGKFDIKEPRIYYGEAPEHYVIVNGNEPEFDYQSGEERRTTVYDGGGGVKLNSFVRKLVYSWEFGDFNIMISDALNNDSRVLYRRNIQDRIGEIAPFLRLDADPYAVLADGRIFWVQDAYTSTDKYPYSTRVAGINYIRNSVKIVVDAFDGTTTFYLVEPNDPIARVYDKIYPDLFNPFGDMPTELRDHLRYPEELFRIQAQLYLSYHIQNPTIFFNREDLWDIPSEVVEQNVEQPIEPYYVIMRLPGEQQEEFALIMPFRPAQRDNTIAWLAARSDREHYGTLLAFRFPTDSLVFGPRQVESRIDQNEEISAQLTLWNQAGSQVIRGNLLMIPIGDGNLFVEPIYLQAAGRQLPELKRVVVANGSNIAMEPTLERALQVVLGRAQPSAPVGGEGGPTPTPGATPAAGETPPDTTPAPTATAAADNINTLIQQANDSFQRAQQLLQQGDFAGYGQEVDRLQGILQRLMDLSGSSQ
ncbi:MAG: UPF0182 family protein [Dehalococcoidia bacterium]